MTLPDGTCISADEICGDGVDQDCNGSDLLCNNSDRDGDGAESDVDCDDTNRSVYPGSLMTCSSASCASGTKKCQSGWQTATCSCTPACEATGSGKCYYIDPRNGSDTGAGTWASAWRTLANVSTYYNTSARPAKWVLLKAGDVVYIKEGEISGSYLQRSEKVLAAFEEIQGTASAPIVIKGYPGSRPVLRPSADAKGIPLYMNKHMAFSNLELIGGYQSGFRLMSSEDITMDDIWVHNMDGEDNENPAGVYFDHAVRSTLRNSIVYDNYDRTNADTGGIKNTNNRNIVLFRGGFNRITHSTIFNSRKITEPKGGGCIAYKHSSDIANATFEVDHNVLWNCWDTGIGVSTWHARIHHNLLINSDGIMIADHGGLAHLEDIRIYNNTLSNSWIFIRPTNEYSKFGPIQIINNVVVDKEVNNNDRSIFNVDPYGTDAMYRESIEKGNIASEGNCFYANPSSALFVVYGADGRFGNLGTSTNFAGWKTLGFDSQGFLENPRLDQNYSATSPNCSNKGWKGSNTSDPPLAPTGVRARQTS